MNFFLILSLITFPIEQQEECIRMTRDCYSILVPNVPAVLRVNEEIVCTEEICRVCTPDKGFYFIDYLYAGDISPNLCIERVADFDANSNGINDYPDFSKFANRFGECIAPNGRVIECGDL